MKKLLFLSIILLFACTTATVDAKKHDNENPKREFRGAWIQCVNGQFMGKSSQQIREMLTKQLDLLQRAGINAILFQVRAEGDALYQSSYEPWSRYLTGKQGTPPADGWDPLRWMVQECHSRNMECHAWINPYRAKTAGTNEMAITHAAIRQPGRIFQYGSLFIFNPALEANRTYTCMVVEDILQHYDVDGIHIDDYFYPYPEAGKQIPDQEDFARNPRGFKNIEDWRRDNVNCLIRDLYHVIHNKKPWVKFGVSPFGIYRNSPNNVNTKRGSATRGTQNYDDLYADVVKWTKEGWVDYIIPQIYWNIGNAPADYEVLVNWWDKFCHDRPLFIGQDVERTVKGIDPNNSNSNQMNPKYELQRSMPHVQGSCQWYAAAVADNIGNYRTVLETQYHSTPALQPLMPFIDKKEPEKPENFRIRTKGQTKYLAWKAPKAKTVMDKANQYVVYRFEKGEKADINSAANIVAITRNTEFQLQAQDKPGVVYMVTALDRIQNESKPVKIKIKKKLFSFLPF